MHTPTPWWLDPSDYPSHGEWHYWLVMGEHGVIANIGGASQRGAVDMESNRANAHYIVKAVNAHDILVHTLAHLIDECSQASFDSAAVAVARTALARAKGEGIKMDLSGV